MIFGIGTDVLSIDRIEGVIHQWGDAFLNRIYSETELQKCQAAEHPYRHYAARFAAKESVAKAFGMGFRGGISFRDIEIQTNALGKPSVVLHGKAKAFAKKNQIDSIHISLSHEDDICVATAIAEGH